MRARKRFGQHFLTDTSIISGIADQVNPRPEDALLEIGPGRGALTEVLYGRSRIFKAIELDRDLIPHLQSAFPDIELINQDVLRTEFGEVTEGITGWRLVGNLPYNISSPLLAKIAQFVREQPQAIRDGHFMLQKEMADRIGAQPGTKAWGRLSVMLQLHFDVEHLLDVPPESFSPPPKVDSSVIRLSTRPTPIPVKNMSILDQVLKQAFSARRKRLGNALKTLEIDWDACGVNPDLRADDVSLDEFVRLSDGLSDVGGREA